jgi:type VI secretion system secreted protein VgrG
LVVGSAYNAETMPASYHQAGLPSQRKISGLISSTTPGGGGSNEITFDDTKGEEMINTHAQNNVYRTVDNNDSARIRNDHTCVVEKNDLQEVNGDQTHLVRGNRKHTVRQNEGIVVDGDRSVTVKGKATEQVGGNKTVRIDGGRLEEIGKADTYTVAGDRTAWLKGKSLNLIGGDELTVVKGNTSVRVEKDYDLRVDGVVTQAAEKATHIYTKYYVLLADESIVARGDSGVSMVSNREVLLKCGENFIQITPDGIWIQGSMVYINSGGEPKPLALAKEPEPPKKSPLGGMIEQLKDIEHMDRIIAGSMVF